MLIGHVTYLLLSKAAKGVEKSFPNFTASFNLKEADPTLDNGGAVEVEQWASDKGWRALTAEGDAGEAVGAQAEKLWQEEKETTRLNESLQLMQLKYASRENVFKTLQEKIRDAEQTCRNYQMKVRDLENQLADQKKTKAQLGSRDSAKYSKPPLPPIRERQPLSRITNRLPPAGSRRSTISTMRAFENKENIMETKKSTSTGRTKTVNKARRISLSPIVRSIPVQPKRRASIAILPSEAEKHQLRHTSGTTLLSQLRGPRRMSVTTFAPLPRTPLASDTPDGKGRFSSILSSGSKYSSPPNVQAIWKSMIPTFASPRQRLRVVSSPTSSSCINNAPSLNKLCFSVQKRVIVGSPAAQPKHPILLGSVVGSRAFRDKDTIGRFGTAQRVLCKNRRQSVI